MKNIRFRISYMDIAVSILLLAGIAYLSYRVTVGLHYRWNWSVIPQYILRYDEEQKKWTTNLLLNGFITTIKLSLWSMFFAFITGIIMGLMRISRSLFLRLIARSYVELIRNVPPLVLIFIFYFFIGDHIMSLIGVEDLMRSSSHEVRAFISFFFASPERISPFLSALVTLILYEGAYMTEIIRAGIESISRGQWEASASSGLARWQQVRFVILPQAFRIVLPPIAGQFISTIKDSAMVSVISIQELTFQGMELMAATYLTFEIWITITAMYFMLTFLCSLLMRRIELSMRIMETAYTGE